MSKTSIIFIIVVGLAICAAIYFLISKSRLNMSSLAQNTNSTAIGGNGWTARMGWRYVSYIENDVSVALLIEPMVKGDDRVYVPNETNWLKGAPALARERRAEILERLKSVAWNRKMSWQECECPLRSDTVISGSLESTLGGQVLENRRLFEPGSRITHEQAHEIWHDAARMFAEQAKGKVTIFMSEVIPNSVFQAVELPTLKKNPNVNLIFK
jgi:hypothetical protein